MLVAFPFRFAGVPSIYTALWLAPLDSSAALVLDFHAASFLVGNENADHVGSQREKAGLISARKAMRKHPGGRCGWIKNT